ncbi:MAG: CoA ester lyase, partial [Acetobacteraceae bacterium]|nr:CoA ester lyase [Acetobacteraceae bacterium]
MPASNPNSWRSLLFIPAVAERFVAKAHTRGADVIILDLEDSIPPSEKEAARAALPAAAKAIAAHGQEICVRINRPMELAVPDITAAIMPEVSSLMLPKVMGPEHIKLLSEVVAAREAALGMKIGHTRFIGVVETPDALPALHAIALADPRMAALGVGSEDLSTELEAVPGADSLYVYGMMAVAAARAARILPLGSIGVFADFSDLDAYRASLRRSRALGFGCAACIHPAQVAVVNEEYGPAPAEFERARRLIAAFDVAL